MKICAYLIFASFVLSASALGKNSFGRTPTKYGGSSLNSYSTGNDKDHILRNDQVMRKDGSYQYEYETSNGINGKENGMGGVAVQGSSSYVSPEGVEIKLSYTADETGYHPVGDHIPKTPDYILRALEYIRTHPPKETYGSEYKKSATYNVPKISTSIVPPTYRPTTRRTTARPSKYKAADTSFNKSSYTKKNQFQNSKNSQRRFRF